MNLGFLTIVQQHTGYSGGYLVTNLWGRPLEFRLSSTVEPGRVHEILYGVTLQPYICADLIGKALLEKATTPVQLLLTDHDLTLDIRHRASVPVLLVQQDGSKPLSPESLIRPVQDGTPALLRHRRYPDDEPAIRVLLEKLDPSFDLLEPFRRIRDAITEIGGFSATRAA
jgi:hypothetical protein